MKKLTNIHIDQNEGKLFFTIQLIATLDENAFMVFVDERDNANNMYSDQSENHSYYYNQYNSEIEIEHIGDFKYNIVITNESIADMNDHIKYIKILSGENNYIVEGVYYNSVIIFNAELTHIKKVCNMCLDDKTMKLIVHIVFKRQLLESALEQEDYNQSIILYNDLCRLLKISNDDMCCCEQVNVDTVCDTCPGGCCSLK